jgi:hypothetical protein
MFSSFTEKQRRIIISTYVAFVILSSLYTMNASLGSDLAQWIVWFFLNGLFWLAVGLVNWIRRAGK